MMKTMLSVMIELMLVIMTLDDMVATITGVGGAMIIKLNDNLQQCRMC